MDGFKSSDRIQSCLNNSFSPPFLNLVFYVTPVCFFCFTHANLCCVVWSQGRALVPKIVLDVSLEEIWWVEIIYLYPFSNGRVFKASMNGGNVT